jgi:hypothetical protein
MFSRWQKFCGTRISFQTHRASDGARILGHGKVSADHRCLRAPALGRRSISLSSLAARVKKGEGSENYAGWLPGP